MADLSTHEPNGFTPLVQHYMKDLVYGANDGIITTFAIVAGVSGASLGTQVAIILGVANLLADGVSMAASNFLSIRSDEAVRRHKGLAALEPFPGRHALVTFAAFVALGSVPLLTFLLPTDLQTFTVASWMTMTALFLVGATRAFFSDMSWLKAGLEMMVVGAAAAGIAFGVGAWIQSMMA